MHQAETGSGPDRVHPEEALSSLLGTYFERPVRREQSIPAGTWRIDAVISLDGIDCSAFGPLGRFLANRTVAVEFFSRPPGTAPLRRCVIKGMSLHSDEATAGRKAALLVLTEGEPTEALRVDEFRPCASTPGVWTREREAFRVVILDTKRLPRRPGWTFWRLMRPIDRVEEDDLRAFAEDETIPKEKRRAIMRIMDEIAEKAGREDLRRVGFDAGLAEGFDAGLAEGFDAGLAEGERRGFEAGRQAGFEAGRQAGFEAGRQAGFEAGRQAGFEAGRQAGFEAGRAEGEQRGVDKGQRTALIALAQAVLGPKVARELEAIEDADTLRRELEARLTGNARER